MRMRMRMKRRMRKRSKRMRRRRRKRRRSCQCWCFANNHDIDVGRFLCFFCSFHTIFRAIRTKTKKKTKQNKKKKKRTWYGVSGPHFKPGYLDRATNQWIYPDGYEELKELLRRNTLDFDEENVKICFRNSMEPKKKIIKVSQTKRNRILY